MATVKLAKPKGPRKKDADVDALLAKVPPGANKPTKAKAKEALDNSEFVFGGAPIDAVLKNRGLKAR